MFYDLEDPLQFMREVHDVLADDGLWVFEQSYMPRMLEQNSYDTVCHEHIEYYALRQIKWMADRVGFVIVDVSFNEINGGSFSVTVKKAAAGLRHAPIVDAIVADETRARPQYRRTVTRVRATRRRSTAARCARVIAEIKARGRDVVRDSALPPRAMCCCSTAA